MVQDDLLKKAYARVGWTKVDVDGNLVVTADCKYPLASTTLFISDVLNEFNTRIPNKKIYAVPIVTGTTDYDLPDDLVSIIDVYWDDATLADFVPTIPTSQVYDSKYAFSADLLESLMNTNELDEISQYRRDMSLDYDIINGKLKILSDDTITNAYILYSAASSSRPLTSIRSLFLDTFSFKLAAMMLQAYLIGKERTSGIQRSGGIVEYTGGSALQQSIDKFEAEWDKQMKGWEKRAILGMKVEGSD